MLRGTLASSIESVDETVAAVDGVAVVPAVVSIDIVLDGYCVLLLIALMLFEVIMMSFSDGF